MALKRTVLEALLRSLVRQASQRRDGFENYLTAHPMAQDYAEFRAQCEGQRKSWLHWPEERPPHPAQISRHACGASSASAAMAPRS